MTKKILTLLLTVVLSFPLFIGSEVITTNAQTNFDSSLIVPSDDDMKSLADDNFSKSIRYRTEAGLDNSDNIVSNIMMNYQISEKFGVYLTPEEEKELEERFKFQESISGKLRNILDEKLNGDYTIYIDQASGGIYNIGLKDPNIDLSEIYELFPDTNLIKVYKINKSERDLDAIHEEVLEMKAAFEESGIIISEVYTDIKNETVTVGVQSLKNNENVMLNNIFGEDITVVESKGVSGTNRYSHYNPLRGGTSITRNNGGRCSIGFMVRYGTANYIVTAGHCGTGSYTQNGTDIGSLWIRTDGKNSTSDSGIVGTNTRLTYSGGRIYNTASSYYTYNSTQNYDEDVVGESVCMSGASSSTNRVQCGFIQSRNYTSNFDGMTFTNQRLASYSAFGGDSGGTVFYDGRTTVLKGIQSAKRLSDDYGIYSQMEYVILDLQDLTRYTIEILF